MNVKYRNNVLFCLNNTSKVIDVHNKVLEVMSLSYDDFYLEENGKKLESEDIIECGKDVKVILRLIGGKGGFGSMLRAIGAQIEKTTNREACRDLSGRRLRDINEEQRLKNWIATQAEREKEAIERKKKKLEKLCQEPKHEFSDEIYDKERSELPERVENAVLQGLEASCSNKRPAEEDKNKKKKKKLWLDADLEELSSSDEESDNSSPEDQIKNSEDSSSVLSQENNVSEDSSHDVQSKNSEDSLSLLNQKNIVNEDSSVTLTA